MTGDHLLHLSKKLEAIQFRLEPPKVESVIVKPWEPAPKKRPQFSFLQKFWYELMDPVKLRLSKMSVILAFVLILWVWGGAGTFSTRIGHGNASKIDFLFDAYYAVAQCTRARENWEMRFQTIKVGSGLPTIIIIHLM